MYLSLSLSLSLCVCVCVCVCVCACVRACVRVCVCQETAKVTVTGLTRHNGVNGGVGASTRDPRWFINCTITAAAPKASLRLDNLTVVPAKSDSYVMLLFTIVK